MKQFYKIVVGVITLLIIGVVTPVITGRGPRCRYIASDFCVHEDDLALQIAVQRGKQAELSAQAPGAKMAANGANYNDISAGFGIYNP